MYIAYVRTSFDGICSKEQRNTSTQQPVTSSKEQSGVTATEKFPDIFVFRYRIGSSPVLRVRCTVHDNSGRYRISVVSPKIQA